MLYSVCIGYLAALGQLAEQGELTALRAAGVSPKRLLIEFSTLNAAVSGHQLCTQRIHRSQGRAGGRGCKAQCSVWAQCHARTWRILDSRRPPVYAHQALSDKDGGTLYGLRQYWLDENLKLQSSLEAEYATYDADQQNWVLHNGRQTTLTPQNTAVDQFSQRLWDNTVTPKLLSNQAFLGRKECRC
ncbi:MAG: hypothetical protein CM15mP120_26460 [Pseudomonadota bacterium]|nr:MAG: hypothetical protein CM15mP120_26460 [Pseudomonadota bacterium]